MGLLDLCGQQASPCGYEKLFQPLPQVDETLTQFLDLSGSVLLICLVDWQVELHEDWEKSVLCTQSGLFEI